MHEWAVSVRNLKDFGFNLGEVNVELMDTFPKFIVGTQYFTLTKVKPNARNMEPSWFSQVGCCK